MAAGPGQGSKYELTLRSQTPNGSYFAVLAVPAARMTVLATLLGTARGAPPTTTP